MLDIKLIKEAIRSEKLDGWLFFNVNHLDPISDTVTGVQRYTTNSRKWFYLVFPEATPIKICHNIEAGILDHLPGNKLLYSGKSELQSLLSSYSNNRFGAQFSSDIPSISYLDAGTYKFLNDLGISLISSAPLIQRTLGLVHGKALDLHFKAADHLFDIIKSIWARISSSRPLPLEKEVMNWILDEFNSRELQTVHSPIVASGINSSNPHFETVNSKKRIAKNEVIQFDIWAKNKEGVYADISWIGFTGETVPEKPLSVFKSVTGARDTAIDFIRDALNSNKAITGADVDAHVRSYLNRAGYKKNIMHRTGHAIDHMLHGWGVNIDSVEFPDKRQLIDGSCFSIEPGIYLKDFGMRSEINCIISSGRLEISGTGLQNELLLF